MYSFLDNFADVVRILTFQSVPGRVRTHAPRKRSDDDGSGTEPLPRRFLEHPPWTRLRP